MTHHIIYLIAGLIKDGSNQPIKGRPLRIGASTFTLSRVGNSEVRVVLETNQGQRIPVMTIPPVPLDIEVRFDVYGNEVRQERWGSYHLGDERNCGDDVLSYRRPWGLGPFERFASPLVWSHVTHSGNCNGRSDVTGLMKLTESNAAIDYRMVGCGYSGLFKYCKGRGWIDATVTAAVEDLDTTSSKLWTETDVREIDTIIGAEPFYLLNTVNKARVSSIEWSAEITYPFLRAGAIVKRKLVLNKNRSTDRDRDANLCFYATAQPGGVLVAVNDYRDSQCDRGILPDPIDFLAEHDPCLRDDENGLGRTENELPNSSNAPPVPCGRK